MFDQHTMWLPGFEMPGMDPISVAPVLPESVVGEMKPLAVEVREYIEEVKTREVWPAAPVDHWNRPFTPVERYCMNVAALKTAANVQAGDKPDEDTRNTLNLFTGWGALAEAFGDSSAWAARKAELKTLLSKSSYTEARKAITTSFFTPPEIIRAMWSGLARLGFKGGKVLEPSAGSGLFLAGMPQDIAAKSQITAVELDESTASVLSALYTPYGVRVMNTAFEKAPLPAGHFDVVIGNVPFGSFKVPENRSVPFRDFLIHDYFIARALEVVRPGGLVAVLTSAGTMDKARAESRSYLARQARLVTAFRLPKTAFKAFAGTEPTTDVLIFQRYESHEVPTSPDHTIWLDSLVLPRGHDAFGGFFPPANRQVMVNEWFQRHRSHILGNMTLLPSGGYTSETACVSDGEDYLPRLQEGMAALPEGTYKRAGARGTKAQREKITIANEAGVLAGSYVVVDGKLCCSEGAELTVLNGVAGKTAERIIGLIGVRDVLRNLIQAQLASADDTEPNRLREELNTLYDAYVKAYGPITNAANQRAFSGDPAAALLTSLEKVDENGTVVKAEILCRRTIGATTRVSHCDSTEEALQVTLAEAGYVDVARMAELAGTSEAAVVDDLACKGAIYRDPSTQGWETADAYLSGDVKTKLAMAELAGEDYACNVAALKEVIPKDLAPHEISARLGSTWIPLSDYESFIKEVFEASNQCTVKVNYEAIAGSWSVKLPDWAVPVNQRQNYGSDRVSVMELFQQALNQQVPTVTDADPHDSKKRVVNQQETIVAREKQTLIKERFVEWLWEKEDRAARLAGCYNDAFNRTVDRRFDGKHLTLPGLSNFYTLRSHQQDAVWRIISGNQNTLLAHCVGAGKTLEMICAGMELKRLGIATKPCYVVPNHMLGQFSTEFYRAYPNARVLIASKEDLAGNDRRKFLSSIATNNWDGIVITHSSFERIKMSQEAIEEFVGDQLAQIETALMIENAEGNKATVRQLERAKREWEARLEKNANSKRDASLDLGFEELGIDWIFLDEAHVVKNLFRFTKMSRVAGLPTSNSERSFDMYLKTRYVSRLHGHQGGVTFATGTPISNSMSEMWVMQTFLQPRTLEGYGIAMFDAWAANYGESVSAIEIAPDGSGC